MNGRTLGAFGAAALLTASGCGTASRHQSFADLTERVPPETGTLLVGEARLEVDTDYDLYYRPRGMIFSDGSGKTWKLDRSINLHENDPETWWASASLPPGEYVLSGVLGRSGSIGCVFPVRDGPRVYLKAGIPAYLGRVVVESQVRDGEPPCWDESLPPPITNVEKSREFELAVWNALTGEYSDSPWVVPLRARIAEIGEPTPAES